MINERVILQVLLGEFYDKLSRLKNLVPREAEFPEAPNKIKVAIGMRRVGKTYFLYQQVLKLLKEGIDKTQVLFLNFEDDRLQPLDQKKFASLIESFYSLFPENHERKCYLFLDEIQNVEEWPQVIRRFHDSKNVEIYLTGSSAKLLSKEISTNLRGRSLATEIWPYSFNEYLRAKKINIDKSLFDKKIEDRLVKEFHSYLTDGGFPEVVSYTQDVRQQTLQEYIDITLYRDIIERHKINHPALIKYMILSLIHHVGRPFVVNKFFHESRSRGYLVGKDVLYEYADYIEDAFLAFLVPLFDTSYRKTQTNPKKLYAVDSGLVRALTLDFDNEYGRLFENIVYLDLKRRGCNVSYYLTKSRYEIDFIAQTPRGVKKFFQVVWDMQNQKTYEREMRALEEGRKELKIEGDILTLDSYLRHGITF